MVRLLRNYFVTLVTFLLVDSVWLGVIARKFYRTQLGSLITDQTNWAVATLFYLCYAVGMQIFVIYPALRKGDWLSALLMGLLYGFFTYMTYDLTNLATLKDWSPLITVVDIAWGTFLGGITSLVSYILILQLGQ
jgi:uncharacterized membrane protein